MKNGVRIDVSALDTPHRRALEEVIGQELAANQQLLINVVELELPRSGAIRPAQSLEDWMHVYDGLSEEQIEAVDEIAKTRANLTRNPP
jgi:hypothetical protein